MAALLRNGAAVDALDDEGSSPLHLAATGGRLTAMEILFASGADVSVGNDAGNSPLHLAASYGRTQAVSMLLGKGADKDAARHDGETAMMCAARGRCLAVVEILIDAGANVNIRSAAGRSALHHAAGDGNNEIVGALLRNGADKDVRTNSGSTPLMRAAAVYNPNPDRRGHLSVFETLMAADADLNYVNTVDGSSLLHHAAVGGKGEIISLVLRKGADIDALDNKGRSPLAWAAQKRLPLPKENCRVRIVERLLAAGADLNIRNPYDGSVPLHHAAKGGHDGTLAVFLFRGADKDALDNDGMSPLMWAAREGHVGEALLAAGADLSIRSTDFHNFSALDLCCAADGGEDRGVDSDHRSRGERELLRRSRPHRLAHGRPARRCACSRDTHHGRSQSRGED